MKTLKQVAITHKFVDTMPDVLEPNVLYISLHYKTASHLCLCGCGQLTITPLKEDYGWRFSINHNDGKVSLTPSIGNYNFPYKSHYIITNSIANFV